MGLLFLVLMIMGIGVSIALHEAGHMYATRIFKGRVKSFSVGFGPTFLKYTKKHTLYTFKLIPLYGYVNIAGMGQDSMTGTEQEGERAPVDEMVSTADGYTKFDNMTPWAKTVILMGGVTVNALFALLLAVVSFSAIGVNGPTTTIYEVARCLEGETSCQESQYAPAFAAGVERGSVVRSIAGQTVDSWADLTEIVSAYDPGDTVSMVVQTPANLEKSVSLTFAESPYAKNPSYRGNRSYLGVTPLVKVQRYPVTRSVSLFKQNLAGTAAIIVKYPSSVYNSFKNSLTGDTDAESELMGPVGLGRLSSDIGELDSSLSQRFGLLLTVLAAINISLTVFNIMPLLPFDGGRIVLVWAESLRSTIYRVYKKKDPGSFNPRIVALISAVVVSAYIVSVLMLLVVDIVNPVSL